MINSLGQQHAPMTADLAFSGGGTSMNVQEAEVKVRAKPKGLYIMEEKTLDTVYGLQEREEIASLLDLESVVLSKEEIRRDPSVLADVEIIMASWGAPLMDAAFLAAAPHLRAVFYGAGSVRPFTTPAFWKRNVTICSAYSLNAQPVAEFTLGVILLSLKNFWSFSRSVRAETDPWDDHNRIIPGTYHSTVGLISCGMIARRLIRLMKAFDVNCVVYDPFITPAEAAELGVELCSLFEVFHRSDVVSLHTPYLPETVGLISGQLIESMKPGATLINTARGGLIREKEMIEALARRKDINAVLDVCDPEPPLPGNPLIQLPNVVLTPHIAGSVGPECRRLGRSMVEELKRYLAGERLHWQITEEGASRLA
jgi:phosphoglycerate dehydrogenase-like enzyme